MIEELATLILRNSENYMPDDKAVIFQANHFLVNTSVRTPNFTKTKKMEKN